MKTAVLFLADGFEEGEALIVVDILRRASVQVLMASITGKLNVTSSRKIMVRADILVEDVDFSKADMIILPGGRTGTHNMQKNEIVLNQCRTFAESKIVAAICAAPSILAGLGLLDGKKATCHPDYEEKMAGAILINESVVIADNIITGQGLGATFLFSFKLVSMLCGEDEENIIKRAICYRL